MTSQSSRIWTLLAGTSLGVLGLVSSAWCQPLRPGDADRDGDFDRFDLIKAQQAAKYLTGQPATWGEGDWNGAPGGTREDPPQGDGRFDQLDIIAAIPSGDSLPVCSLDRDPLDDYCVRVSLSTNMLTPVALGGTLEDNQTSVVYGMLTGEILIDAPLGVELTSININSDSDIFTGDPARNLGGPFDEDADSYIFKATFGSTFGSISFGNVAKPGLSEEFLVNDLAVDGSLEGGGGLGVVDLVVIAPALRAGDADQDLDFDQADLVQVLQAAKYLTGLPATWGEGDWDGAPGGAPGAPPQGNGRFDQIDIIAALNNGCFLDRCGPGPYAALQPDGQHGDGQTSVVYDPSTGEIAVDAPSGVELTSINIDSADGIFTGDAAQDLGSSFDNDADGNIFKATFGSSFGSLSFGHVARAGLSKQFMLDDLIVVGSLAGGGDLGDVDMIYVPEPSTTVMLAFALLLMRRRLGFLKSGRPARLRNLQGSEPVRTLLGI